MAFAESDKDNKDAVLGNSSKLKYWMHLEFVGPSVQNDLGVLTAAVADNGHALRGAGASLKENKALVTAAVSNPATPPYDSCPCPGGSFHATTFHTPLSYAGDGPKADKDVVIAAVTVEWQALKHAADTAKDEADVLIAAINSKSLRPQRHDMPEFADEDRDYRRAMRSDEGSGWNALQYAGPSVRGNKAVFIIAVTQSWQAMWYASDELKGDKDLLTIAVSQSWEAIKLYASDSMKCDTDLCTIAVSDAKFSFEGIYSFNHQGGVWEELERAAVTKSGYNLKHARDSLKEDKGLVTIAVTQYGEALQYAGGSLKGDKGLVTTAVTQSWKALQYADGSLKEDMDLANVAIAQSLEALRFVGPALKKNFDWMLTIITNAGDIGVCEKADLIRQAAGDIQGNLCFVVFPPNEIGALLDTEKATFEAAMASVLARGEAHKAQEAAAHELREKLEALEEAFLEAKAANDWKAAELAKAALDAADPNSATAKEHAGAGGGLQSTLTLEFKATNLDAKDMSGKSDPFMVLSRDQVTIHKTKVIKSNLNPSWPEFQVSVDAFCGGDHDATVTADVYDWDRLSKPDLIGSAQLTLGGIACTETTSWGLINPKKVAGGKKAKSGYENSGVLNLVAAKGTVLDAAASPSDLYEVWRELMGTACGLDRRATQYHAWISLLATAYTDESARKGDANDFKAATALSDAAGTVNAVDALALFPIPVGQCGDDTPLAMFQEEEEGEW